MKPSVTHYPACQPVTSSICCVQQAHCFEMHDCLCETDQFPDIDSSACSSAALQGPAVQEQCMLSDPRHSVLQVCQDRAWGKIGTTFKPPKCVGFRASCPDRHRTHN